MLTFFRKIRKGLLGSGQARKPALSPVPSGTEGKVERYLFYAVGEIALVVIGILIALQINNWNEWRKDRIKEIDIYHEIQHELEQSLIDIKDDLQDHMRNQHSTQIVLGALLTGQSYHDSLMRHIRLTVDSEEFTPKSSAFESLKSVGLHLLSSDTLRRIITEMYQVILPSLGIRSNEFSQQGLNNGQLLPLIQSHLTLSPASGDEGRSEPFYGIKDYEALVKDERLKVNLEHYYRRRRGLIGNHRFVIGEIEKLLDGIKDELARMD